MYGWSFSCKSCNDCKYRTVKNRQLLQLVQPLQLSRNHYNYLPTILFTLKRMLPRPLVFISYTVASIMPSLPGGKPLLCIHSRYDTGMSLINVSLYLPKGILVCTASTSIFGSGPKFSTCKYKNNLDAVYLRTDWKSSHL